MIFTKRGIIQEKLHRSKGNGHMVQNLIGLVEEMDGMLEKLRREN